MPADVLRGRLLLWGTALMAAAVVGLPAFHPLLGIRATIVGPLIGIALFLGLAGTLRVPRASGLRPGRALLLTAASTFEELVWRGVALAWLAARAGLPAALALTSTGFAAAHRGRHGGRAPLHLATGAGFGIAFACAGLAAAILAHSLYNLLVDLHVQEAP